MGHDSFDYENRNGSCRERNQGQEPGAVSFSPVVRSQIRFELGNKSRLGVPLANTPFQFICSNVPAGVYNLLASVADNLGATHIFSLVTITNEQPRFVKLESPQGGGGSVSMLIAGEAGQVYELLLR
jgi:hypothetical protein